MYAKNVGALRMLGECSTRCHLKNVLTGRTMIFGHVKCGQGKKALGLFQQMQQEGVQPDSVTFVGVLRNLMSLWGVA
ncbi:hypothetical protein BDL97_17G107700 [Sphagnum fallax]|jgi:pentatricopeptide repeat protein|uniref:Pentatricopeptide repeat-containing protein n=1 Tax=Sphagnum jensenii TaxID=128206 RepID=A0ABP0WJD2_9BRYO|nr:hypothetical protein BDL97_17G107700 [Sphagnum fallax]